MNYCVEFTAAMLRIEKAMKDRNRIEFLKIFLSKFDMSKDDLLKTFETIGKELGMRLNIKN